MGEIGIVLACLSPLVTRMILEFPHSLGRSMVVVAIVGAFVGTGSYLLYHDLVSSVSSTVASELDDRIGFFFLFLLFGPLISILMSTLLWRRNVDRWDLGGRGAG